VLELGCGTGFWLSLLLERGLRVDGLDPSSGMLERAATRAPGARLSLGHAEALPFANDIFDRVCAINAFHHFEDKARALREAARVLRPGGRFFSVGLDPAVGLDDWYIYRYFTPTRELDRQRFPKAADIHGALAAIGFTDCRSFEVERLVGERPAREALDNGLLGKQFTSQLSILTDREYQQGIARIREDIAAAEARGETLVLKADLRLYGTLATLV
jgi:SAM-dependent methyltransferase